MPDVDHRHGRCGVTGDELSMPPFSVLLPVYRGDEADRLHQAFHSTVTEQTLRPAEVVIVQDGPVGTALADMLEQVKGSSPVPVTHVRLPHNAGLAAALQRGLAACSYDVVARVDADDVSRPHRFCVQVPLVAAGADLVGSSVAELRGGVGDDGTLRVPPLTPAAIAAQARWRSPFNHPTVVYRRSAVMRAGGYRELPLLEDYWLFARMVAAGAVAANVAEPLVLYRVDAGAYERRGGWRVLRSEVRLQHELRAAGFTSWAQAARNILVRGGYRLVPVPVRRALYARRYTSQADHPLSTPEAAVTRRSGWPRRDGPRAPRTPPGR